MVCADSVARHVPLTSLPWLNYGRRWLCALTITRPTRSKVNQLRKYHMYVNRAGSWRAARTPPTA
jgi:hypothetical protein